ncbi:MULTISPECIES: hypothetical protein [unclassified Bradyrhizobium]|uniref:hypothetical protein n=1 Tax=unclassified Bradyrhizobium TaxID=2631580 RepID=UPI0020B45B0D|nr:MULTISPECIES: hypothetical protein [unclassified Bradyrhizobium]MCP3397148.1 hypothetical protein [Bradyrhizobium sp. CCGB20]MCP3405657.1 hypothetical protein [Bradyrhizobium sp. CCGB01]
MAQPDLLEAGIYTIPEAAELVHAAQASVRVWVEGHTGKQLPVIRNQLGKVGGKTAVSFANLMELRFIARFATAGVGLREIRNIMHEASEVLNHPHPFATRIVFKTDGSKIVAEIARRNGLNLVYDLRSHNYEMPSVVMKSFREDVEFDPHGEMIAWTPRPDIAPNVIVHPKLSFGHPVLKTSRIPTATIAKAVDVEGGVKFVADIFEIPERQVREAVKFENQLRRAA